METFLRLMAVVQVFIHLICLDSFSNKMETNCNDADGGKVCTKVCQIRPLGT